MLGSLDAWIPKTSIGRMVKEGLITSIDQLFAMGQPIKEAEIVDILLPGLSHEIIDVGLVQKQTDTAQGIP